MKIVRSDKKPHVAKREDSNTVLWSLIASVDYIKTSAKPYRSRRGDGRICGGLKNSLPYPKG